MSKTRSRIGFNASSPAGYPMSARVANTQWLPCHLSYGLRSPASLPMESRPASSFRTRGEVRMSDCNLRIDLVLGSSPSAWTRSFHRIEGSSNSSNRWISSDIRTIVAGLVSRRLRNAELLVKKCNLSGDCARSFGCRQATRPAAAVSHLALVIQKHRPIRRCGPLNRGRHFSCLRRFDAAVAVARRKQNRRICRSLADLLVWRLAHQELELIRIPRIAIFEKSRRIVLLETRLADHVDVAEVAENRPEKIRTLRECRCDQQSAIARALNRKL